MGARERIDTDIATRIEMHEKARPCRCEGEGGSNVLESCAIRRADEEGPRGEGKGFDKARRPEEPSADTRRPRTRTWTMPGM